MVARIDAVLVAGGRSRRFGADKRREPFDGRPMAGRALALLRAAADGDVFVAGHGAFDSPVHAIHLGDLAKGAGPLGGILAALAKARFGVLVLPCDTPLLRAATVDAVARVARRHGRAVCVRGPRGVEPMVAFYPRAALPALLGGLKEGVLALHRLLERLSPLYVEARDGAELRNVNTREDHREALASRRRATRAGVEDARA